MKEKYIVVNYKHYREATGTFAIEMLNTLKNADKRESVLIGHALGAVDLHLSKDYTDLNIFSQHVDDVSFGAFTGKISMESLMEIGIKGSLLNHSENRIKESSIEETVGRSRKMEFDIMLCVESKEEAVKYSKLEPSFIAYEPPELIGGDISVTSAKPDIVSDVVAICEKSNVNVIVGAGVKNGNDVRKSIELGAVGVLISSGVIKSSDPLDTLNSLILSALR